jgi:hypothetical protein
VSLYLREPGVKRVSIKPYPKRRNDSFITIGGSDGTRDSIPRRDVRQEVCYADFFRATTELTESTSRVA